MIHMYLYFIDSAYAFWNVFAILNKSTGTIRYVLH